mgnify:CR=1 FL=1|jgi:hypothetical protein
MTSQRPIVALLILCVLLLSNPVVATDSAERFLSETSYLNYSHPLVSDLLESIDQPSELDRARARLLHDYVRDAIPFGFSKPFYDMSASDVLRAGRGFANNKATLLIALLRGAGIPARHKFVSLSSGVLTGLLGTGGPFLDHSLVEIYLEGRWIAFDSFVTDRAFFWGAQALIGSDLGFGVRRGGSIEWDGQSESYSQYHPDYVEFEFGVYDDIGQFYASAEGVNNRLGFATTIAYALGIGSANEKIESIRKYGQQLLEEREREY